MTKFQQASNGPLAKHMQALHFYPGSQGQPGEGEGKAPNPKCFSLCHWRKESGQARWELPGEKKREEEGREGRRKSERSSYGSVHGEGVQVPGMLGHWYKWLCVWCRCACSREAGLLCGFTYFFCFVDFGSSILELFPKLLCLVSVFRDH